MLIIGNGFLGSYLAKELGAQTFSRENADFVGDVLDTHAVRQAVQGQEVIVYAVGFPPSNFSDRVHRIAYDGLRNVMSANHHAKIIFISAVGADSKKKHPYFHYKGLCEEYVKNSGRDYQIVRPGVLAEDGNFLLEKLKKVRGVLPYFPGMMAVSSREDIVRAITTGQFQTPRKLSMRSFLHRYTQAKLFPLPRFLARMYRPVYELITSSEEV